MRMCGGDLPGSVSQSRGLLVHGSGKSLPCRVHEPVMVGRVSRGVFLPSSVYMYLSVRRQSVSCPWSRGEREECKSNLPHLVIYVTLDSAAVAEGRVGRHKAMEDTSSCPGTGHMDGHCVGQRKGEKSSCKGRKTGAAQHQSQTLLLTTVVDVVVVVSAFKTICREPSNILGLLFI